MEEEFEGLIVGGGLAGASVAWHLAERGATHNGVWVLLESEALPGVHASAQNAAMVRGLVEHPGLRWLAFEGQRFWNRPPESLGLPPEAFRPLGSLLLASRPETAALLRAAAEAGKNEGVEIEILDPANCLRCFPFLEGTPFLCGFHAPRDGIADPAALLQAFLRGFRERGGRVETGRRVERLLVERDAVAGALLKDGSRLRSPRVCLAPGAWHDDICRASGIRSRALRPHRRHLFCTTSRPPFLEGMPGFVWHVDAQVYFRPEGEGLLFSACDEDAVEAGVPAVADEILEWAHDRLGVFPWLRELQVGKRWAGLRTFAGDRRFLLGADLEVEGLFHAAGLGGHGVTCAGPVGRLVARCLVEPSRRPEEAGSPAPLPAL